jgi:hypothetical protein
MPGGGHQTTRGNDMSNKQQLRPGKFRAGRFLAIFAILLMISLRAFAPTPLPFQLSITPPDSDSFIEITASNFYNGEYSELILQSSTNLTAPNWTSIQTNIGVSAGSSSFIYKVSRTQAPVFFRVAGIYN